VEIDSVYSENKEMTAEMLSLSLQ